MFFNKKRKHASYLNAQGIIAAKEALLQKAQHLFEQAIELSPDYPLPKINLSNILCRNRRYSQAEFQLIEALQLSLNSKNQQNVYNNLGNIRYAQKRLSEAIKNYKKAIEVYRADDEIYYNIGISYEELGEWKKALEYFQLSYRTNTNYLKAQISIERIKQRMSYSPKMDDLLHAHKGFDYKFPNCGISHLTPDELKSINIDSRKPLLFFVGAGVSYPYPSSLPLASDIIMQLFHFVFELDKAEIRDALKIDGNLSEEETYRKICRDLLNINQETPDSKCFLPFEASFQALNDILGFPVIRFVDLLKKGEPNLHHKMLAHALNQGHTVITTNFDKKIETAYSNLFKGKELKILISDKDYQETIDSKAESGVLAKIHGDMDDYNSLALTLKGVGRSSDSTICIHDDLEQKKGFEQAKWVNPQSTLSIPKAIFLQNVLHGKLTVIMGYSGSDAFDIMPILKSSEFQCSGIWVVHTRGPISDAVNDWKNNYRDRNILQPKSIQDQQLDMTAKVSRYFLDMFDVSFEQESNKPSQNGMDKECSKQLKELFKTWIKKLCLQKGDGLCFLGKLYEQRGLWEQAIQTFSRAAVIYSRTQDINDFRLLATKSNIGYLLDNLGRKEQAIKHSLDVKLHIESEQKQEFYSTVYYNTLIDIGRKWMNTSKDNEAGELVGQAMQYAQKVDDKSLLSYGLRTAADRHFRRKEYDKALEIYLRVLRLAADILGELREACLASMHAGICYIKLGAQYKASQMLSHADSFAKMLGDDKLYRRS